MANYPQMSNAKLWTPMDDFDPMWVDSPSLLNKSWNVATSPLHEMAKVPDKLVYGASEDGLSLWLIDATTDETWLSFKMPEVGDQGVLAMGVVDALVSIKDIAFANGSIFVVVSSGGGTVTPGLYVLDLIQDVAVFFDDSGIYEYIGRLRDENHAWSQIFGAGAILPGEPTSFVNVLSGQVTTIVYTVDNGVTQNMNFVYYKGLVNHAAVFVDAAINAIGAILDNDTGKCVMLGSETAIAGWDQVLFFEHVDALPNSTILTSALATNILGVCGDASAWLPTQRLHGATLNNEHTDSSCVVKMEKSDSILESQIGVFVSMNESAKVTAIKQLRSGTIITRSMDCFAFRPYSMVGLNGVTGNDWLFSQFGTTSVKIMAEFNPYGSWLWNNGTTDITPRANTMTLVAAPVWNAAGYLPLDGATQYGHATVAVPLNENGFSVFATVINLGSAGTIIAKYDHGAAPATSSRMFRFFVSAGREICLRVWDSSVTRAGVDTYIGRKSFALPAFAFTRDMTLIGIYRGNANLAGSENIEIWMNGIRIDIADDEANAANFVEIEDLTGVELSVGADYTAGAAARFLTTTGIARAGILYGPISSESIARFTQVTSFRILEETGATGYNPLLPAATNTHDVLNYWVQSSATVTCPYNAYLDFLAADDAYVALPNGTLTAATTGLFVSFWIKPTAFTTQQVLISKTAAAYEIAIGGIAAGGADNHIHVQLNTNALGGGNDLISTNTLGIGAWNHVAFYYNPTFGRAVLIVNGEATTEAYAVAVTDVPGAVLSIGQRAGSTRKYSGGFCGLRFAVNVSVPDDIGEGEEMVELMREEYALGLASLSVTKKFSSNDLIWFTQNSARPVMVQDYYAYVTDEDGEFSEILTIPDGSRNKTYTSVFYTDDGARNIIYSDGTREIATVVTQTEDQKVQMAIRQAVAKAVQRNMADGIAYYTIAADITLQLPLPTETIITADATAGAVSVNLPPATGCKGKKLTVKKLDAGANTVDFTPYGVDLIDTVNAAVTTAIQFEALTVYCDGVDWYLI